MTFQSPFPSLSLSLINLSILSEYLSTILNASTTNAAKTIHISIPHHVVNGINSNEYAVVNTEITLVTVIIIK